VTDDEKAQLSIIHPDSPPWPVAFVKYRRLHPSAIAPKYMSRGAAGADLHALIIDDLYPEMADMFVVIEPWDSDVIRTGIAMEIPTGTHGMLKGRSGGARDGKESHVGTIDCDYRGELHLVLHNNSNEPWQINNGDRVGQIIIIPTMRAILSEAGELSETARGSGGLGSTGTR
jgi:dUTP pyrophosphatase